jgi:LAO/AO transport system kinase
MTQDQDWNILIDRMLNGSLRALGRLISRVENREPGWIDAMKRIFPHAGRARLIGITGAPGAGKSTLVNSMARELVERGRKIGIIAVDPSSPFTGGSILGDRLRMRDLWDCDGVFIRSMATRGAMGGLNQATRDTAKILDAFGKDFILIETVGVGQDEIEVVKSADVVIVVCVPGQGDTIQAMKAGIMEIADVFVINKADRPGTDQLVMEIENMLELTANHMADRPLVLTTIANQNNGITELVDETAELLAKVQKKDRWLKTRIEEELLQLIEKELLDLIKKGWEREGQLALTIKKIQAGETDPYSAAEQILNPIKNFFDQTK